MASEERVWQAARFLHEAHRARASYQPMPDAFAPRDINEAYDIQEAFQELLKPERGLIVGYKVALTTAVMQKMVGFGHPCSGAIFARGVHHSPATIKGSDFVHLGAECEIAVLLSRDLPANADWELQMRLIKGGYKPIEISEVLFDYRRFPDSIQETITKDGAFLRQLKEVSNAIQWGQRLVLENGVPKREEVPIDGTVPQRIAAIWRNRDDVREVFQTPFAIDGKSYMRWLETRGAEEYGIDLSTINLKSLIQSAEFRRLV